MSWSKRSGKSYYYQSRRVNGKVTKSYFGCGDFAKEMSEEDHRNRERRLSDKRDLVALESLDKIQRDRHQRQMKLSAHYLENLGYHRPGRWRWRKKQVARREDTALTPIGTHPSDLGGLVLAENLPPALELRIEVIEAALQPEANPEIKELAVACLREFPEGLPEHELLKPALSVLDKDDPVIRAYEESQINNHALELAGDNPSKMVLMIAEAASSDLWYLNRLRVRLREKEAVPGGCSPKNLEHFERLIDRAHRRYLASMKTLVELRRLNFPQINVAMAGSVQVNGGVNQVNLSARAEGILRDSPALQADSLLSSHSAH